MILRSQKVLTMDDDGRTARAVRVEADRIVAVHGESDRQPADQGEPVFDFGDRPVIPGFVDVHAHYEVAARAHHSSVDVRAPACGTIPEVLEVLREAARQSSEGWVVGQGNLFFDQKLAEGRLPTREELDSVSTDLAIALRAGGHITVLNSTALERSGIDESYAPPQGSVTGQPIVEREGARPTGVVKEMDNLLPLPKLDRAGLRDALRDGAMDLFTRNGVTTVGEITESVDGLRAMDELALRGELPVRVAAYQWVPGTMSLDAATSREHEFAASSDHLSLNGVKIFADGGFTASSAAVKRPYARDPESYGTLAVERDYVAEVAARASEAGLQLAIHANGERAQELVCDALVRAADNGPLSRPPRIEHAGNFLPDLALTDRWREAGIIPVPQPVFIFAIGNYLPSYVGDYGRHGQFPFRTLIDRGWQLSGSSDVWIGSERSQTRPMFSIWCCVERRGYSGDVIEPEQAITVEEALWMHTRGGALVLGQDDDKGSITPGKLADLVVLAEDPREVAPSSLAEIEVDYVFLGGRLIYERAGAAKPEGARA
ncbi:MAG: amidohydrolase [Solirubrobacterales bacterium]